MNKPDNTYRIDLDRTPYLERHLSELVNRIGFSPIRFVTSIPHFATAGSLIRLIKVLPNFFEVEALVIEVGDDQKIPVAEERDLMRQMSDADFPISWDVSVSKLDPFIIGQLYYLCEAGKVRIHTDYTYEAAHAVRSNNVPWELTFNDQTFKEHEIRDRENISESTLRAPAVVRRRLYQRAIQWCLCQISRLRPKR